MKSFAVIATLVAAAMAAPQQGSCGGGKCPAVYDPIHCSNGAVYNNDCELSVSPPCFPSQQKPLQNNTLTIYTESQGMTPPNLENH